MDAKKLRSVRFNDDELETISKIYPMFECENISPIFDSYDDDEQSNCLRSLERIYLHDDVEFKRSGSHSLLYGKMSMEFESPPIRPIQRKRDNDLDISHHISRRRSMEVIMGSCSFEKNVDLDTNHHQRRSE
jgi:hypothetical protein